MEVFCIRCRRRISRQFMEKHYRGHKCDADHDARVLLSIRHLVPYPRGHDLPDSIPRETHVTRARYEGQRLDESGAVIPIRSRSSRKGSKRGLGRQVWVPFWVRIVEGAWARLGLARKNRRDRLLSALCHVPMEKLKVLRDLDRDFTLQPIHAQPGLVLFRATQPNDEAIIVLARALAGES